MAKIKKRGGAEARATTSKKNAGATKKTTSKSSSSVSIKDRNKNKDQSKKRGFSAMRQAREEQKNRQGTSSWRGFFIREKGDTRTIVPLVSDLFVKRVHTLVAPLPSGKVFYPEVLCTEEDDCKWCERAKNKDKKVRPANATGALFVLDVEGYSTDDKDVTWVLRPWSINTTMASVLENKDSRIGLKNTFFDVTRLDRGHSMDEVRDRKDKIQRFDSIEDLIEFLKEDDDGNEETAKQLEGILEEYETLDEYFEEEVIPQWWGEDNLPESVLKESSDDDDDDTEDDKGSKNTYSFRKNRKSDKDGGKRQRRSRVR